MLTRFLYGMFTCIGVSNVAGGRERARLCVCVRVCVCGVCGGCVGVCGVCGVCVCV